MSHSLEKKSLTTITMADVGNCLLVPFFPFKKYKAASVNFPMMFTDFREVIYKAVNPSLGFENCNINL